MANSFNQFSSDQAAATLVIFMFFLSLILVPGSSGMEGLGDLEQGTEYHHSDHRVGGMDDLFMSMQPEPTVINVMNADFFCKLFVLHVCSSQEVEQMQRSMKANSPTLIFHVTVIPENGESC